MELYFDFNLYIMIKPKGICAISFAHVIYFNIISDSDSTVNGMETNLEFFYEQFDNNHIVNVDFTVTYCKICIYTH